MGKIEINLWLAALLVGLIMFHGEPDIVDAIVYHLTGEWQTASGFLATDK